MKLNFFFLFSTLISIWQYRMFVGDLTVPLLYSPIIFNAYLLLMCGYVHKGPGASGGQKGVSAPMELELQAS